MEVIDELAVVTQKLWQSYGENPCVVTSAAFPFSMACRKVLWTYTPITRHYFIAANPLDKRNAHL